MSQQAGYSPSFKRPAEIMRMRRKRARSDAGVFSSPSGQGSTGSPGQSGSSPACVRPFSPGPLFNTQNRSGGGIKRRNPFANIENTYSPKKKFLIHNDDGNAEAADSYKMKKSTEGDEDVSTQCQGVLPFSARVTEVEKQEHRDISSKECVPFCEDDSLFEEEEEDVKGPLLKSPQAIAPASISPPICTEYPADWSLKTRLLFTSPLSLSWAEHPKAQEEALGLSQHCRAHFSTLPHSVQDPRSCSELRCAFRQSLVYWQHPSLPWISLFPRINAERSFTGKSTPWAQDTALQHSLMSEWAVSLSSLYSLLKARLCPYFYLCSYQFTVLFRAAGVGGSSSITALISPTTRGLREAMKAEGIEFSLPLIEERRKSREQQNLTVHQGEEEEQEEKAQECSELKEGEACRAGDEGENDGYNDDEDGSFSWLKEMGVQDKIKKPDSITIQLRKEGHAVSLDHKPESVVCVEGSHTFTLINFLINCRSVVAAAGSQAGLPPTLLAPVAFRGATMHTLKARSVNVKSRVGSTFQNISTLEITGPVLPSSLCTVATLLRSAQKGNFSAALYTHIPSAVMNTHTTKQQYTGGSVDLSGCGLHPASIQQLQQPSSLGKTALTHINMNNYSYTWKN
ncbi:protein downstream neighbor of son homolog isoform X2 [Siniperca chuatsi]|uniref:protein downstream neighbor of son homolog isoform X2 n=1 Tax=Siniperca chuatsi TaxID=119488 RepID=UPI001CE1EA7D|nr:protein downstream neighbor of son homolog isoform X2 [Siniperca chuatsi]